MATFNRFNTAAPKGTTPLADDDEDEYLKLAAAKVDAKAPPAVAAVTAKPSTTAPQPVAATPVATLPRPAAPAPKPVATLPGAPSDPAAALRKAALGRMDEEDARSGFANDPQANDGGGMNVVGNGNRGDVRVGFGGRPTSGQIVSTDPATTGTRESGLPTTQIGTPATGTLEGADPGGTIGVEMPGEVDVPVRDRERPTREGPARDGNAEGGVIDDFYDSVGMGDENKPTGGDDAEDLEAIARAREDKAERDAAAAEMKAGKAKALMMANARAQLAGMGLSGATAALEGDISRTQDRSAVLADAELARNQRDEGREDRRLESEETRADADAAFLAMQRKLAVNLLEEQSGQDEDGDGDVNDVTSEEQRKADLLEEIARKRLAPDGSQRIPLNNADADSLAAIPEGPYKTGTTYMGSDREYDYFENAGGGYYKVRR